MSSIIILMCRSSIDSILSHMFQVSEFPKQPAAVGMHKNNTSNKDWNSPSLNSMAAIID